MRTRALALLPLLAAACTSADRIELDPGALRFAGRGKSARIHATPREKNGRAVPDQVCVWSSTDEKVATVQGAHNNATVTAAGPGAAAVRCTIGPVTGEVPVTVRVVARVAVRPERAEVRMLDDPAPLALEVQAFDDQGAPLTGRVVQVSCASEDVCRGDARGQLWGVGPGETTARIAVEGAEASIPVKVTDGRTAEGKPKAVKGNPMEEIEKAVRAREAREAREAAKQR
jgi:hypothetical protein